MAIALDAVAGGEDTASATPLEWTHTPVGTPRAIKVYIISAVNTADRSITAVSYGGVPMGEVAGSPNETASGEVGGVSAWFLGSGIPTGPQTVSVTFNDAAAHSFSYESISYTADQDCSIVDVDATINASSQANPSVTLSAGGVNVACSLAFYSGQNAPTGVAPLTNWTSQRESDVGNEVCGIYTYDIVGSSDVTAGWTQTADDAAMIAMAIRENAVPVAPASDLGLLGVGV